MNKLAFLAAYWNKEAAEGGEEKDIVPGGLADNKGTEELAEQHKEDPKEIEKEKQEGTAVEMEHTNSPEVAEEIAEDHIEEIPDYYDRLEDMEEEAKTEQEQDLDDPTPLDKEMIFNFLGGQQNLDDDNLHKFFVSLGVDPHEGEEIIYSALQQFIQNNPSGLAPAYVQERETDEEEEDAGGE